MLRPLEGRTVALAEGRQLEELAGMLEKEGAIPVRCPMVSIHDVPDPAPVLEWIGELIAGRFALVVLMTGEALSRLLSFAERQGQREALIAALGQVRIIARGPKPVRVLREIGLSPSIIAQPPTTEGVIAALRGESLAGQTVGVTLFGGPNPPLRQFLEESGAEVREVLPYIYAPAADGERVAELITRLASGGIDVLIFTSSPQVDRLFEVASQRGLEDTLRRGLERVRLAAVGPVVADNLRQRGIRIDICPDQGFVMKNLVQLIRRDRTAT